MPLARGVYVMAETPDQSCIDTYSGTRATERQVVEPHGREAFTLTTRHAAATCRLCSQLDMAEFTAPG